LLPKQSEVEPIKEIFEKDKLPEIVVNAVKMGLGMGIGIVMELENDINLSLIMDKDLEILNSNFVYDDKSETSCLISDDEILLDFEEENSFFEKSTYHGRF
jgi:hypothetical protein